MSVAVSPDQVKPKPTEVVPVLTGRIRVETPEGTHQQMVRNVVTQTQQIKPGFTAERAYPQSADVSLQQNPHLQAVGAIVKDENGFPFTGNDARHGLDLLVKSAEGEPSKIRTIRGVELVKKLAKRIFGKKNAGPSKVVSVGE